MKKAKLTLCSEFTVGKTDPLLFGSFIEHLGRAVYGGIYEPSHPKADENGFREDVMELIREANVSVVRYPGGNFVSGYCWKDGIGPVQNRPKRLELAWGTTEPNWFGTDEFMKWCKKTGVQPMMAVNLGTGTAQEARELVEYCNHPEGTYWSDLRKQNGSETPYGIKYWCLGNEMDGGWQMGHKNACDYGKLAREAAKLMKWTDPDIKTVLCGSSSRYMSTFGAYEYEALQEAADHIDYVSVHQYLGNSENDYQNFLAKGLETEKLLTDVQTVLDYFAVRKNLKNKINISFDEWNVWYHSHGVEFEKWCMAPHILEDVYNLADALVSGTMLNAILRHCDRVKIACLAQLVNVIAPIMTQNGGAAWKQTIYYPFALTAKNANGTSLQIVTSGDRYDSKDYTDVPLLDASAVLSEDENTLTVFAVNRSVTESLCLTTVLADLKNFSLVSHVALEGEDLGCVNTENAQPVKPVYKNNTIKENGNFITELAKASWNMLIFRKNPTQTANSL